MIEIKAGNYSLSVIFGNPYGQNYWLQKEDGEGMSMTEFDLQKMFEDYFKENF